SPEAHRPLHRSPSPTGTPQRRSRPPLSAGACGADASDLLPANQGHPEVRLSPLSPFPNFPLAPRAEPRRKPGRNPSSVLQCPPGTSSEKKQTSRGLDAKVRFPFLLFPKTANL